MLASDHGSTDQSVSDAAVSDSAVQLLSATQTQSPLSATVTDTTQDVPEDCMMESDRECSIGQPIRVVGS